VTKRWLIAAAGALVIAVLLVALVWAMYRMRTASRIDYCLDRGGAWDYDAHACQTA
jgi:hypothetical protein